MIQARPVKIYLKQAFYACANPPGIFLSLLPAPQQAILDFNQEEARKVLYGVFEAESKEDEDDDDSDGEDDESDGDEESEDDDESDEDYSDEDYSDDDE